MSNFSLMQIERGSYLKSPHLVVQCIWLNTNVLQGSPANYVGTEPIFVSNVKLYRFKHLIIIILHSIQLLQGRLGLWVRAPGGSPEEKPKGDNKKTSPTKSIFCGTFLLPFGDLDRQKEGIDGQKLVPNLYPRQIFQKRGTICRKLAEHCRDLATLHLSHYELIKVVL